MPPRFLADKLNLSQPRGTDHAHHITTYLPPTPFRIFRTPDVPELYLDDLRNLQSKFIFHERKLTIIILQGCCNRVDILGVKNCCLVFWARNMCKIFYFDIKFGDRLYSKEKSLASSLLNIISDIKIDIKVKVTTWVGHYYVTFFSGDRFFFEGTEENILHIFRAFLI